MSLKLRAKSFLPFNGIIFRSALTPSPTYLPYCYQRMVGRLYNNTWKLEINKRKFYKIKKNVKVCSSFFLSLLSFPLKCKVGRRKRVRLILNININEDGDASFLSSNYYPVRFRFDLNLILKASPLTKKKT